MNRLDCALSRVLCFYIGVMNFEMRNWVDDNDQQVEEIVSWMVEGQLKGMWKMQLELKNTILTRPSSNQRALTILRTTLSGFPAFSRKTPPDTLFYHAARFSSRSLRFVSYIPAPYGNPVRLAGTVRSFEP